MIRVGVKGMRPLRLGGNILNTGYWNILCITCMPIVVRIVPRQKTKSTGSGSSGSDSPEKLKRRAGALRDFREEARPFPSLQKFRRKSHSGSDNFHLNFITFISFRFFPGNSAVGERPPFSRAFPNFRADGRKGFRAKQAPSRNGRRFLNASIVPENPGRFAGLFSPGKMRRICGSGGRGRRRLFSGGGGKPSTDRR